MGTRRQKFLLDGSCVRSVSKSRGWTLRPALAARVPDPQHRLGPETPHAFPQLRGSAVVERLPPAGQLPMTEDPSAPSGEGERLNEGV